MAAALGYTALFFLFAGVMAQDCEQYSLCRDCITLPQCTWCSDNTDVGGAHCFRRNSSLPCSQIEDPHGSVGNAQEGSEADQVTPTVVRLSLRVGEPQNFTVRVTPRANYPLDLYILMDLSSSMSDDLNMVKSLSSQLASTIRSITENFRIGFGAFNEKPILPFVSDSPLDLEMSSNCSATSVYSKLITDSTDYSYRHVISLTNDTDTFIQQIATLTVSSNLDAPEALLDGLLQAVVCGEVVGWRENARRLILILTDRGYHIAGDGKLAGIPRPHDGNCYTSYILMGSEARYNMWGVFDYPSIGQISAKLREYDIIPIFAVTQLNIYQNLLPQIEGAVVLQLSSNSQNFLTVIERSYNATAQRVELQPDSTAGVNVAITPDCGSSLQTADRVCEGVNVGQMVTFQVNIMLTACTEQLRGGATERVSLRVPGFGRVSVEISGICSCDCENVTDSNSTECSGTGHLSCGICECLQGWFGQQCQCSNEADVTLQCPTSGADKRVCSGRGTCECGICICDPPNSDIIPAGVANPIYYGEACEFENFLCPINLSGVLCSGRGQCHRNRTCICMASPTSGHPYLGTACECPPMQESCLNSTTNIICNDHGRCNCDRCECEEGFEGRYCETPPEPDIVLQCNVSIYGEECVRCAKNLIREGCTDNCSVVLVDSVGDANYKINGMRTVECFFSDSDGCLHFYFITGEGGSIHAENERVCDHPAPIIPAWAAAVIALSGIFLIGIIVLVIIKLVLVVMDWREYRKWVISKGKPNFSMNVNPLYKSPNQEFKNVTYQNTGTDL